MSSPETKNAARVREEYALWSQAMKQHDADANAYFAELTQQIRLIESRILEIQTNISDQISELQSRKTGRKPAGSSAKTTFNELESFYAKLDQASLEKNVVGSDRELREWVSECIAGKQKLDRLVTAKHKIETSQTKHKKEGQLAQIEADIQIAKANREECQKRVKLGIMQRRTRAFEEFWKINEEQLDKMIAKVKQNEEIRPLLERLKELKDQYSLLKQRYDEQRKVIVDEIDDSYAAFNSFELELDKLAFPEKYQQQVQSMSKITMDRWPDPDHSDPVTFSKEVLAKIAAKIDYSSLRGDDMEKCFKDPVQTPYQKLAGEYLSPATSNEGLFFIASVGAGKTLTGLTAMTKTVQWHIDNPSSKRNRLCVILLPNENLFYNWEKDLVFFGPSLLEGKKWKFISTSKVTTREWRLTMDKGDDYVVVLHKYSTVLPEKYLKSWKGILPNEGLVIVDECQNLVQPMKLSILSSSQEMALSFGKELSKHPGLKRLIMTATPLLDETRVSDLFKLLNIVKNVKSTKRYKNEGAWRRGQTMVEELNAKENEKMQRAIHNETEKILSEYFDMSSGKWHEGARKRFMIENLGIIANVRLEGDIGVYPTVNTIIPNCDNDNSCVLVLQRDSSSPNQFMLNPYAQGERPLTKEEMDAIKYKDYRHIRSIKLAVPLGPLATKAFLANLPKAKKILKLDCKKDDVYQCIDWTSKANPLSTGKGYSLKTRREGKKKEYASKAIAFGEMLKRYPNAKHFGITPARIYGDGPKAILDYLVDEQGFAKVDLNSIKNLLTRRETSETPWKKATDSWYADNPASSRVIYFGRMQGEDDPKQRSLFAELAQNIWNDPRNVNGTFVQAFIGDRYAAEGLNLLAVQYVHLFEPLPFAMKQQSLGRALRYCAAKLLDPSKRNITIFTYVAEAPTTVISGNKKVKELPMNMITADQYLYDKNSSSFDPINELYKALAEVSIDCLLMKDYNQLSTCFPFEKKPEVVVQEMAQEIVTKSKVECKDPRTGTIIDETRMRQELDQFGYVFLEPNFESQCRQLGYILDKDIKYDLKDEVLLQLFKMNRIEPLNAPFERYEIMRRAEQSPGLQEGALAKVIKYVRGFWQNWTQKGESMPRETTHYVVDKNGNVILDLQEIPLSLKEKESGKPYKYDRVSYDLASRLLLQELDPKVLIAILNRINNKDASIIYQYLLTKRMLGSFSDLAELDKKARQWIIQHVPEHIRELKLESLQKKTKKRPNYLITPSISKKLKSLQK